MFDPRAVAESGFEPEVKKVDGQFSQERGSINGTSFLAYRVVQLNFTSISRVKSCWTSLYGFSVHDLTLYLFQVTCMVILLL